MPASTHPQLKMQHYIPPPKGGSQDDPAAQVRPACLALLAGPHSAEGVCNTNFRASAHTAAAGTAHPPAQLSAAATVGSARCQACLRRRRWSGRRSRSCTRRLWKLSGARMRGEARCLFRQTAFTGGGFAFTGFWGVRVRSATCVLPLLLGHCCAAPLGTKLRLHPSLPTGHAACSHDMPPALRLSAGCSPTACQS